MACKQQASVERLLALFTSPLICTVQALAVERECNENIKTLKVSGCVSLSGEHRINAGGAPLQIHILQSSFRQDNAQQCREYVASFSDIASLDVRQTTHFIADMEHSRLKHDGLNSMYKGLLDCDGGARPGCAEAEQETVMV